MTPTQRAAMLTAFTALRMAHRDAIGDGLRQTMSEALQRLQDALAEPVVEPLGWEWRWFDTNPNTVTFGQWTEWKRVEPRNSLCTVEDSLNEFRAHIANGNRYELRALYTSPNHQPKWQRSRTTPRSCDLASSGHRPEQSIRTTMRSRTHRSWMRLACLKS